MNCPKRIDSRRLEADSDPKITQEEFISFMLNPTHIGKYLVPIPKGTMLFHGSPIFPRVFNQLIQYKGGQTKKVCDILSKVEGGLSESVILDLHNTRKLSEKVIQQKLSKKNKKYEMIWLNFNWYSNRYIATGFKYTKNPVTGEYDVPVYKKDKDGNFIYEKGKKVQELSTSGCNPCKSMVMFLTTQNIYVFNFVRLVMEKRINKNRIERIQQDSKEKLYIIRKKGAVGISKWDEIGTGDYVFSKTTTRRKGFVKKSESAKRNALYVTNNQFYTSGYSGLGILFAQYMFIRHELTGMMPLLPPVMGYFDIDFAEAVDMQEEDWVNKYSNATMCGCFVDKKGRNGICPELMLLKPQDILNCMDIFYTTINDYTVYIDPEEERGKDFSKALPLETITKNIIGCVGAGNFNMNPQFDNDKPLDSMYKNIAPWFKVKS